MSTKNGKANGGRFAAGHTAKHKPAGAGKQILVSLLLLADLFMVYTMIMQLTHHQKAFQVSMDTNVNKSIDLALLVVFALAAVALIYVLIRTRAWKRALCLLLVFAVIYLTAAFSKIPIVEKYRTMWIDTAMSTMSHQGLATYYFPSSMVEERVNAVQAARDAQVGENTPIDFAPPVDEKHEEWPDVTDPIDPGTSDPVILTPEQKAFYRLFYELDYESTEAYFNQHPEVLANGYEHILINETKIGGDGTSIRTKLGEKVLAIDMENQVLILEVDCDGSRGVMAIGKLPSRLKLCPAAKLPYYGEVAGSIAKRNGGILAMTGSAFNDPGGAGNGGEVAGYAMCSGKEYNGVPFKWGYKRLELHDDGWFYINDTFKAVGKGTTNAMEFSPAMVINGKKQDIGYWTDRNPRASIGQSVRGEILMLCVEGRGVGGSLGCDVGVCADVLLQHDCITAMNCDGGTTAIMWYRGEPILRCSNTRIPQGRYLPNAWVYVGE